MCNIYATLSQNHLSRAGQRENKLSFIVFGNMHSVQFSNACSGKSGFHYNIALALFELNCMNLNCLTLLFSLVYF